MSYIVLLKNLAKEVKVCCDLKTEDISNRKAEVSSNKKNKVRSDSKIAVSLNQNNAICFYQKILAKPN